RKTSEISQVNVIVDIFRSTTTIPIILKQGASYIVPFKDAMDALNYTRSHPGTILIGEKYGIKPPFFDYDNSPSEIADADLSGKVVAFTSTNGMHVLDKIRYGRIFIASIVNFHSTVETLRDYDDISIMPSNRPVGKASEDNIFANLLKEELEKKDPDIERYIKEIIISNDKYVGKISKEDLKYCTSLDYANFTVTVENGKIIKYG
ncbi:MAG: 2-phosphosulfolactate phosphatase, partial [Thermoplasmata archaeon]